MSLLLFCIGIDKLNRYNYNDGEPVSLYEFWEVMLLGNKYRELSQGILTAVGGEENIVKASHCATRLRIVLKRSKPSAKDEVSQLPGVVTVVENNGQFQVVIGNAVRDVYQEFENLLDEKKGTVTHSDEGETEKQSVLNRIIATMSAVFAPFIYILAAAGILQGLLIIINLIVPTFEKTGTYQIFNMISWAPFVFLPIFISVTAAKHFNVNVYIAIACNAALVSPDLTQMISKIGEGQAVHFIGIPLSETTYTSSVLPPLLLVWVLSYLEKFLNKTIHEVIRPLFTPFFSIVIMVPLTLLIIGPLSTLVAHGIAGGYNFLVDVAPWLAGTIIGAFWQVFVVFGVHWGITPVVLANFEQYKSDSFQAFQTIAVISQVGAVFGVLLKSKQLSIKRIASSAGVTGIFGITEPSIYGVNLRFKKPFIIACMSGGIGAFVASFFNPKYYAYAGLPGPITIVNGYSASNPSSIWGIVIGALIAFILPIILIQVLGYGEDTTKEVASTESIEDTESHQTVMELEKSVFSPIGGQRIDLQEVNDPIFAEGMMGKGTAIIPNDDEVMTAPFDGKISMIAPSKHAVGIISEDGVEILIHVGLDTVKMNGEGFEVFVKENESVQQGQQLLKFNKKQIEDNGYESVIPIIVTNSADFEDVLITEEQQLNQGSQLLTIIKK